MHLLMMTLKMCDDEDEESLKRFFNRSRQGQNEKEKKKHENKKNEF
jgi:hypothetical protein